jgi:hypothetical protein
MALNGTAIGPDRVAHRTSGRSDSFANAEAAEDFTQEIIRAEFPRDLRQRQLGLPKVFRQQFTGLAIGQGLLSGHQ